MRPCLKLHSAPYTICHTQGTRAPRPSEKSCCTTAVCLKVDASMTSRMLASSQDISRSPRDGEREGDGVSLCLSLEPLSRDLSLDSHQLPVNLCSNDISDSGALAIAKVCTPSPPSSLITPSLSSSLHAVHTHASTHAHRHYVRTRACRNSTSTKTISVHIDGYLARCSLSFGFGGNTSCFVLRVQVV